MTSFFTWLDYSERERRKMLDAIALFREQDTRDELGIGIIRDAFADLLFPGTSTIQRRARYFLFVPWIYLRLEKQGVSSSEIAERARSKEIALINVLAESEDSEGTIGVVARASLKRLPSNIYWQGLGQWGIRLFPGSQEQYHRSLDSFYSSARRSTRENEEDSFDERTSRNWQYGIPNAPSDFPRNISFTLTAAEAEYLQERIMSQVPKTLLAFLVDRGRVSEQVAFPWEHHQLGEFPDHIQEQLEHARNFSDAIHGAALLYNLMLAEESDSREKIDHYNKRIQHWFKSLELRRESLFVWNRKRFWEIVGSEGARIPPLTRIFVDSWLDLAFASRSSRHIISNNKARDLLFKREIALKRGLARLDNKRALELWSGAAGTEPLNYRWQVSQIIILDILKGLSEGESHA